MEKLTCLGRNLGVALSRPLKILMTNHLSNHLQQCRTSLNASWKETPSSPTEIITEKQKRASPNGQGDQHQSGGQYERV